MIGGCLAQAEIRTLRKSVTGEACLSILRTMIAGLSLWLLPAAAMAPSVLIQGPNGPDEAHAGRALGARLGVDRESDLPEVSNE